MAGTFWALGEIDFATASAFGADLRYTMDNCDDAIVTVDCSGVTFMGTAGFRVLVEVSGYAARRGRTLVISNLSSSCALLIRLCDSRGELHVEFPAELGGSGRLRLA
jgi:anti-anti-sigma factor